MRPWRKARRRRAYAAGYSRRPCNTARTRSPTSAREYLPRSVCMTPSAEAGFPSSSEVRRVCSPTKGSGSGVRWSSEGTGEPPGLGETRLQSGSGGARRKRSDRRTIPRARTTSASPKRRRSRSSQVRASRRRIGARKRRSPAKSAAIPATPSANPSRPPNISKDASPRTSPGTVYPAPKRIPRAARGCGSAWKDKEDGIVRPFACKEVAAEAATRASRMLLEIPDFAYGEFAVATGPSGKTA